MKPLKKVKADKQAIKKLDEISELCSAFIRDHIKPLLEASIKDLNPNPRVNLSLRIIDESVDSILHRLRNIPYHDAGFLNFVYLRIYEELMGIKTLFAAFPGADWNFKLDTLLALIAEERDVCFKKLEQELFAYETKNRKGIKK